MLLLAANRQSCSPVYCAGFEAAVAALPGFDQAVAAKLQQREQGAACAQLQAGMGWTDQRTRSQQRAVYQQSDPEQQEGEPKQQENELQGQEASGRQTAQPKQQEDDLQGQVSRGMRQQVPRLQPQQGPKGRPRQQQAAEKRPGQQQAAETPSRQQAMQSEGHLGCRSTRSRQAVGGLPQQQVARLKGRPGAKSSGCAGTGAQPVTDKPVKRQRARSEGRSAAQSGGCASLEAQPAAKRRRTAALARQPQAAHDEVAPQKGAPHAVDRPLKQPVEVRRGICQSSALHMPYCGMVCSYSTPPDRVTHSTGCYTTEKHAYALSVPFSRLQIYELGRLPRQGLAWCCC